MSLLQNQAMHLLTPFGNTKYSFHTFINAACVDKGVVCYLNALINKSIYINLFFTKFKMQCALQGIDKHDFFSPSVQRKISCKYKPPIIWPYSVSHKICTWFCCACESNFTSIFSYSFYKSIILSTSCDSGARFTNGFSITIQIRWKFRVTLSSILIQWSLQNFVHGTTAVLSWHVQKFLAIWWPATELWQGEVSIEFELRTKKC